MARASSKGEEYITEGPGLLYEEAGIASAAAAGDWCSSRSSEEVPPRMPVASATMRALSEEPMACIFRSRYDGVAMNGCTT